jgi:hypothetical protein
MRLIRLSSNVLVLHDADLDKPVFELAQEVFRRDNSIKEAAIKYRTYNVLVRKSIYQSLYVLAKQNNKVIFSGIMDTSKSFNALMRDFSALVR